MSYRSLVSRAILFLADKKISELFVASCDGQENSQQSEGQLA
jgi:hypothetical protein